MKEINTPIFGKSDMLEESDLTYEELKFLVEKYPVNALSFLNKLLNEKGFTITVDKIRI